MAGGGQQLDRMGARMSGAVTSGTRSEILVHRGGPTFAFDGTLVSRAKILSRGPTLALFALLLTLTGCASIIREALDLDGPNADEQRALDKGNAVCSKYEQPSGCVLTMTPADMERLIEAKGGMYGQDYHDFALGNVVAKSILARKSERRERPTVIYQQAAPAEPKRVHCSNMPSGVVCNEY